MVIKDQQVARVGSGAVFLGCRNKQQVHGRLQDLAGRHMDVAAIEEKGGVQRGKGIFLALQVAAELLFDLGGLDGQRLGETGYSNTFRQSRLR